MTHEETVALARYVRAACPQQAMDRYTPDAWHDLIGDLELADCKQAVIALVGARQVFVAPAEIRAEVQRIRTERIARSVIPAPPRELCDDPRAYQKALQEAVKQAADGHGIPATGQPPAVVGDSPRRQIPVSGNVPSLRRAIAGLRQSLPRPRPATIPDEQRALEQAAESREARPRTDETQDGAA